MTAQTPGQPSLWALPAQRAHDAFFASIGVEDLIDDWHEDMDDNRRGAWENAMEAAYPSMRDEYVRLSIERDDARAERNQASASYQQAAAELESVTRDRDKTRADLAAMTVDRDRYRNAVLAAVTDPAGHAAAIDAISQEQEHGRLVIERDKAYRERAALVAYLAACYPAVWDVPEDVSSDDPDAPVIISINTPSGQMCWRVSWRDMDLFPHVPPGDADWDGHTTEERNRRLAGLTRGVALCGPQRAQDAREASGTPDDTRGGTGGSERGGQRRTDARAPQEGAAS